MEIREIIDEIMEDEKLGINDKIDKLKSCRAKNCCIFDEYIKELESKVHYCPICGRYYMRNGWMLEEGIEKTKMCVSFNEEQGSVFKDEDTKVTYGWCPEGHKKVISYHY